MRDNSPEGMATKGTKSAKAEILWACPEALYQAHFLSAGPELRFVVASASEPTNRLAGARRYTKPKHVRDLVTHSRLKSLRADRNPIPPFVLFVANRLAGSV